MNVTFIYRTDLAKVSVGLVIPTLSETKVSGIEVMGLYESFKDVVISSNDREIRASPQEWAMYMYKKLKENQTIVVTGIAIDIPIYDEGEISHSFSRDEMELWKNQKVS